MRRVLLVIGLLILLCIAIGLCRVQVSFGEQFSPAIQSWIGEYVLENSSPPTTIAISISPEGNGTIKAGGMTWGFSTGGSSTQQLTGENACSAIALTNTGTKDPISGLSVLSVNITQQTGAAPISLTQFIANGGCLLPTQLMPTWLVNNAGQIYKGTADYSKWVSIPGQLTVVKLNSDYVVGVNSAGNVFKCKRPCSGSWQQICGGSLVTLDIEQTTGNSSGGGANIWGINAAGQILFAPVEGTGCETWTQVPLPGGVSTAKCIAVNSNAVYITDSTSNQIYYCPKPVSATSPSWTTLNNGSWATWASSISASDTQLWTLGGGNGIYVATLSSDGAAVGAFVQIQGAPGDLFNSITGTGSDYVWGIGQSQHIYQCPQPCQTGQWTEMHGLAAQIASLT